MRIVLTGALGADSPIAEHHRRHGDGIRDIALSVPDVDARLGARDHGRGAEGLVPPHELRDEHGAVRLATIAAYGDTVHTFVERRDHRGAFLPGYEPRRPTARRRPPATSMLLAIDHIVGNVELGAMEDVGRASTSTSSA